MKKLSIWARNNPVPARWIIVMAQILTIALGGLAGLAFYFRGIELPKEIWLSSAGVLMAVLFLYPAKGRAGYTYFRQKSCDFTLVLLCFVLAGTGINRFAQGGDAGRVMRPAARMIALKVNPLLEKSEQVIGKTGWKQSLRERKKQLRSDLKKLRSEFRHSARQPLGAGAKVALIILTVLVSLGLAYLVAALACNISCSGASNAVTLIVLIGGWLGVIFLAVFLIRMISRSGRAGKKVSW